VVDTFALTDNEHGVTFSSRQWEADGWLEQFLVTISAPGREACAWVVNSRYIASPEEFFSELAAGWRGWSGEKLWYAIDQELQLVATADSLGHVTLQVQLQPSTGAQSWRVVAHAYFEAGQLESLAERAARFFRPSPNNSFKPTPLRGTA